MHSDLRTPYTVNIYTIITTGNESVVFRSKPCPFDQGRGPGMTSLISNTCCLGIMQSKNTFLSPLLHLRVDAGKVELDGASYLGLSLPFSITQLLWIEAILMGGAEIYRNNELDLEKRIYPGVNNFLHKPSVYNSEF